MSKRIYLNPPLLVLFFIYYFSKFIFNYKRIYQFEWDAEDTHANDLTRGKKGKTDNDKDQEIVTKDAVAVTVKVGKEIEMRYYSYFTIL